MLEHLLSAYPWVLLGGVQPGEHKELLSSFWKAYRWEHGSHAVYQLAEENKVNLESTIPLALHGDGGRTQKKQPLEVVSMCPVLGLDTLQQPMTCSCENSHAYSGKRKWSPFAQRLNLKNTSYATHFLVFAYPSKKFKKTPGLFQSLLRVMSESLREVCENGLDCNYGGNTYHFNFAILGIMKGDQEFHQKTGLLSRSYMNVGYKNPIPCCSDCLAGGPGVPFEDSSLQAVWRSTVCQQAPWNTVPPFEAIQFEDWTSGEASRFFKRDVFHIFRLGIARNFIGSALVLLCFGGYFDDAPPYGIEDRLGRAWANFMLWCAAHSVSPSGIRSFSKQKIHMPTMGTFPWVGCKASDTILLLKWMRFFTNLKISAGDANSDLKLIAGACDNGLKFQGIYRHGIWLKNSCRGKLMANCQRFTTAYAKLAASALRQNMQLFAMVPKFHSFDHVKVDLEPRNGQIVYLNPATWCCSMSEDFIGRVSRQSRRVSYIKVMESTLLAYKVKARFLLGRLKKARGL